MTGEWHRHRPSSLINRFLLAPKIFNLFYSASLASLIPFLPIYFRLLGLTAFQSGLLGAGRGFISFWSTPIWCLSAERFDKRKCFLLLMLMAGIALNVCLGLANKDDSRFGAYLCNAKRIINYTRSNGNNINQETHLNNSGLTTPKASNPFISRARAELEVNNSRTGPRSQVVTPVETEHENVQTYSPQAKNYTYNSDASLSKSLDSSRRRRSNRNREIPASQQNDATAVPLNHSSSLRGHMPVSDPFVHVTSNITVPSQKSHIKRDFWFQLIGFRIDPTFKLLLILILVTEFVSSPIKSLSDSLTSDILQWSRGNSMATNRAWGFFGFMVGAGTVAVATGIYGCSLGLKNSFYLHFYVFVFFGAAAFIFGTLFQNYNHQAPRQLRFASTCKFLCCDIHILSFLLILWAIGVAESLHSNFMMWYLQDIDASNMAMGLILITIGFSELFMHVLAPYLMRCIGQEWIMFLSMLSYGGRFLYFSYIRDPWLIVPIELLHGLSQTTMWHACASYAMVSTPHGMERTMQTIFVMVYKLFGTFVGGVGVSLLYQLYGPVVVFRCAAGVCGVYCILFGLLQCILGLPDDAKERRRSKLLEYREFPRGRERNGSPSHLDDWLLEALDADEDDNIFSR